MDLYLVLFFLQGRSFLSWCFGTRKKTQFCYCNLPLRLIIYFCGRKFAKELNFSFAQQSNWAFEINQFYSEKEISKWYTLQALVHKTAFLNFITLFSVKAHTLSGFKFFFDIFVEEKASEKLFVFIGWTRTRQEKMSKDTNKQLTPLQDTDNSSTKAKSRHQIPLRRSAKAGNLVELLFKI